MAGLTPAAIIVLVIVGCLAIVSGGAALYRTLYRGESDHQPFQRSYDQEMYMRSVRRKNLGIFHRESLSTTSWEGKDVESRYTSEEVSSRG